MAEQDFPDNKYYIFGKDGGKNLADEFDIPFLGQIPLVQSIREGGDIGVPIMMSDDEISKQAFIDFAANATRGIAMRNAQMPATEVSQVLEISSSKKNYLLEIEFFFLFYSQSMHCIY